MNKLFIVVIANTLLINGCSYTSVKVPAVVRSHAQQPQPMQVQRMTLTDKQMLKGKRLAKKVKKQLIVAQDEAVKAGGRVHVVCPSKVPSAITDELKDIGVSYTVDYFVNTGYIIELSKNNSDVTKSKNLSFSETQAGK